MALFQLAACYCCPRCTVLLAQESESPTRLVAGADDSELLYMAVQ